jgi:hypothetical protein
MLTVPRARLPGSPLDEETLPRILGYRPSDGEIGLLVAAHWAGNLNVWFDSSPSRAVEAHRALDLELRAGQPSAILVMVPPREEGFDFTLTCDTAGWTVTLLRGINWYNLLVVQAGRAGECAAVNLTVRRQLDRRTVPVEFSFRSVEAEGGNLGCVRVGG